MYKEIKVQKEVIEKHKYCDVCGTEINRALACSIAKCNKCGKDLCENCIEHEDGTSGDYRIVYCERCWIIGKPYREPIADLGSQMEDAYNDWRNATNQ